MKRDKYDDVFSACIREFANWTCERCGCVDPDGQAYGKSRRTHCSHIFGRRHRATRWHPDNACCLCAGCHLEMGDSPIDHAEFARKVLGDVRFDALRLRSNTIMKWTKAMKHEMFLHYKAELQRCKDVRAMGEEPAPLVSYE